MKGVNFKFCKKKLSMTKKKVVRNFGENRRQLFQDFLSENKFPQNFCPPNIYDKSTPVLVYIYICEYLKYSKMNPKMEKV